MLTLRGVRAAPKRKSGQVADWLTGVGEFRASFFLNAIFMRYIYTYI